VISVCIIIVICQVRPHTRGSVHHGTSFENPACPPAGK
jgi:hypothetical protein